MSPSNQLPTLTWVTWPQSSIVTRPGTIYARRYLASFIGRRRRTVRRGQLWISTRRYMVIVTMNKIKQTLTIPPTL